MTSFSEKMRAFALTVDARSKAAFVNIASATLGSIRDGSPITGAPGQPVDTGALKASWQLSFDSPVSARVSTDKVYAPGIEDGIDMRTGKPLVFRSTVGGPHSVALTIAGFNRLVADEVSKLGASGA